MGCVCCCIVYLFVNGKSANCSGVNYGPIDEGFWCDSIDDRVIDEYTIFCVYGFADSDGDFSGSVWAEFFLSLVLPLQD